MYGGSLKGNGALHGGAIYTNTVLGCLNIGNDAFIQAMDGAGKNDIYLNNASDVITITSALNNHDTNKKINIRVNEDSFGSGQTLVSAGFAMSDELLGAFQFFFTNSDTEALVAANKKSIFINKPIYVAGTGYDNSITQAGVADGNGSSDTPFNSLTAAFNLLTNPEAYYNIRVNGTITGTFELPSDKYAESVLLEGVQTTHNSDGSPKDTIDGAQSSYSENGTTLKINTATKFTIKNLKVTGGKNTTNGGGIYVRSGATLVLDTDAYIVGNSAQSGDASGNGGGIYNDGTLIMKGGVVNNNTVKGYGGGIYSTGSVYIYGDAVIGDKDHKDDLATSDEGHYGNKSKGWLGAPFNIDSYRGGGIACKAESNSTDKKLYLGYDENGEKAEWRGGVYYNFGQGVRVENCEFKMDSGTISGNNGGGGIYYQDQHSPAIRSQITGGLITKNKNNDDKNNGSGLDFSDGVINITGGKIKGNFLTESGKGTDVYASAVSSTYEGFSIGGSACFGIIYLQKSTYEGRLAYLRITDPLEPPVDEGGITATLKIYEDSEDPSDGYRRGDITLKGFGGYAVTSQDAQKILATDGWELFKDDDD